MATTRTTILALMLTTAAALAAPEKPPIRAPLVFVEALKADEISDVLTFPARLVPRTSAVLLAEQDGIVSTIRAPLGRAVKRGDLILSLANTDPVYRFAPLAVRSPVSGVVSAIDVTEGSRVSRGQRLGTVTDPKRIKITVEVAAADLSALKPGLLGSLSVPSADDPVPVEIAGISPFVDPATGTATVELAPKVVAGTTFALPPGLVGRVSFRVREHRGFQISEQAIVYRGQTPAVRIVENGKAKYVTVTLGPTRRGLVEVIKGLPENANVIVRASGYVAEGETVDVQKSGPPS